VMSENEYGLLRLYYELRASARAKNSSVSFHAACSRSRLFASLQARALEREIENLRQMVNKMGHGGQVTNRRVAELGEALARLDPRAQAQSGPIAEHARRLDELRDVLAVLDARERAQSGHVADHERRLDELYSDLQGRVGTRRSALPAITVAPRPQPASQRRPQRDSLTRTSRATTTNVDDAAQPILLTDEHAHVAKYCARESFKKGMLSNEPLRGVVSFRSTFSLGDQAFAKLYEHTKHKLGKPQPGGLRHAKADSINFLNNGKTFQVKRNENDQFNSRMNNDLILSKQASRSFDISTKPVDGSSDSSKAVVSAPESGSSKLKVEFVAAQYGSNTFNSLLTKSVELALDAVPPNGEIKLDHITDENMLKNTLELIAVGSISGKLQLSIRLDDTTKRTYDALRASRPQVSLSDDVSAALQSKIKSLVTHMPSTNL